MLRFALIVLFEAIGSDLFLAGYETLGNICHIVSIALLIWTIAKVVYLYKTKEPPDDSLKG